jgi:glycosyltransferase involved in cell wall biosynthesis
MLAMRSADVTVIVTTFQQPAHLARSLASIAAQRTSRHLEVIVADDGSRDQTPQVVEQFARQSSFPVRFVTRSHRGFQAAANRNAGVREATGPHLLFCDGDCLLPPNHVEQHLAAWRPNTCTSGYCVRLDETSTRGITLDGVRRGEFLNLAPAAELRRLAVRHVRSMCHHFTRHPRKPALRSTDFSIARVDFERVNGFDEEFSGWGCEDDDLGQRLIAAGIRPVSILNRTRVYHMWHPSVPSKPATWREGDNVAYLKRPVRLTRCMRGLNPRNAESLTVHLGGQGKDRSLLKRFALEQGWQLERQAGERADLELVVWPGTGKFTGQGDCPVLVVFDDQLQEIPVPTWWRNDVPRCARIVVSPRGNLAGAGQTGVRLDDASGVWRTLCDLSSNCAPTNRVRPADYHPAKASAAMNVQTGPRAASWEMNPV